MAGPVETVGADGENLYSCQQASFSQCSLLIIAEKGIVLDALRQTRRDYAVMLAVFLFLSQLPATYLTGVIYRPLGKLTTAIREVSSGDLETRIEISSGDEIEVLAGEFNQMLGKNVISGSKNSDTTGNFPSGTKSPRRPGAAWSPGWCFSLWWKTPCSTGWT